MGRRAQRGFTLVEMMVVVAIIAILGALVVGVSSRPFGANARNVSDQIVSTLSFAKLRASATRRIHRVIVEPQRITVWPATTTGLGAPGGWEAAPIQTLTIPKGVVAWHAQAGASVGAGAAPAQSTTLQYTIDFRPDGQATASTIFVTDSAQNQTFRVLVYHATGGSYARQYW